MFRHVLNRLRLRFLEVAPYLCRIGVRGAGLTYDGGYYVTSVTHNLQRGEYTQDFTLAREGLISLTRTVIP